MKRIATTAAVTRPAVSGVGVSQTPTSVLQRLGNRNVAQLLVQRAPAARRGVDATAQGIIDTAKDAQREPSAEKRAVAAVWSIVRTYYAEHVDKIKAVSFKADEPGLSVTSEGRGDAATGSIEVGSYFLDHIDQFARRVLQVGHELQHVDQYRARMTGRDKSAQREFLAFYWEALQEEKPGTGAMSAATRRSIVDAALGYLLCLSADEQRTYADKRDELLAKRRTVDGVRGNAPVPEPTQCRRQ